MRTTHDEEEHPDKRGSGSFQSSLRVVSAFSYCCQFDVYLHCLLLYHDLGLVENNLVLHIVPVITNGR